MHFVSGKKIYTKELNIYMISIQKTKKLWMIGTALVILFVSSFSTINNSILPIKAVTAEGENNEDEETAYLKFASQAVKQSDNSSAVNDTIQLPEAAKGPPIPAKGYLVQQIGDGLYWLTDGSYNTMFMLTYIGFGEVDHPSAHVT